MESVNWSRVVEVKDVSDKLLHTVVHALARLLKFSCQRTYDAYYVDAL